LYHRPEGKGVLPANRFGALDRLDGPNFRIADTGKVIAGVPHVLFQTRIIAARIVLFQYAVSPGGKRFLINSLPSVGAAPLTLLMN
jgi:hypothetical protein